MRLSAPRPLVVFTLSLLWGISSGAVPAAGQASSWSRFGIGYVANAPSMMAGVGAYILFPGLLHGWGLYGDAKFDPSSPAHDPYFLHNMTAQQVEDSVQGVEFRYHTDSWQGFNLAVVRPVTPALMLYVGGGYAKRQRYNSYRDPAQQLGQLGLFWAQATDQTETTLNFMVGGFLRMSRYLTFQTGIETRPVGFTVGGWFKFPPR
jgi:hypothetical protein